MEATTVLRQPHDDAVFQQDLHGKARVVLLPVDPYTVHVYWELDPDWQKQAEQAFGKGFLYSRPILRFYDLTQVVLNGKKSHPYFDIPVDLAKRNCYVHLWSPQKTYVVDLGWKTEQGRFFCAGRSNTAHTPSARPAEGESPRPGQPNSAFVESKSPGKTVEDSIFDSAKGLETEQRPTPWSGHEVAERTVFSTAFSHSHIDLSAMSENAFESGISSARAPSSPDGKEGQED
jgi:hypothetical protein